MPKTAKPKAKAGAKWAKKKPSRDAPRPKVKAKTTVRGKYDRANRRWWTDDERKAIMLALKANGGNVALTAKEQGVSYDTLYCWAKGHRCPEALQLRDEKSGDMATALEEAVWHMIAVAPSKVDKAPLNHIWTSIGIGIDKARLIRGHPGTYGRTDNVNVNVNADVDRMAENYARMTPDERAAFNELWSKVSGRASGSRPGVPATDGSGRQLDAGSNLPPFLAAGVRRDSGG